MAAFLDFLQTLGLGFGWIFVWLVCCVAVVLSSLSISGTWLVVLAAMIANLLSGSGFPGWATILVFAVLSGLVETFEAVAGAWGVTKRGGSHAAGFAALAGGLIGMVLGGFVPVPVAGPLLGMLAGSFLLAFLVEKRRLQKADHAAHIARGAVIARLLVVLVKLGATLGMIAYLALGATLR